MGSDPAITLPEAQPPAPTAEKVPKPTIHAAELESGASGRVLWDTVIEFDAAVVRRRAGQNVVVCGSDVNSNRRQA